MKFKLIFFIFFIFQCTFANTEIPKSTKNFGDWQVNCTNMNQLKNCEASHLISIQNQNNKLEFKIVYNIFENNNNSVEVLTIITPLGVNLLERPAIIFEDSDKQINIPFVKCETYGCILTSNSSLDTEDNKVFKTIKNQLMNSNYFTFAIGAFMEKPFQLEVSLNGFKDALKELKKTN